MTHIGAQHADDIGPPPQVDTPWTQERIGLLLALREQKMGRADIAVTINNRTGSQFTKSAICGKIDRLFPHEIKHRLTAEQRAENEKRSREKDVARQRENRRRKRAELGLPEDIRWCRQPVKVQPLAVVVFRPEDFTAHNVGSVADLESHHCRYPLHEDDPAAPVFCGLPKMERSSYCSRHHQIAWLPPQKRRAA